MLWGKARYDATHTADRLIDNRAVMLPEILCGMGIGGDKRVGISKQYEWIWEDW
jgi:hypothetical protein